MLTICSELLLIIPITSHEQQILKFKKILESFTKDKTTKFIELYFGNNAINTTELNYILPIYDFL